MRIKMHGLAAGPRGYMRPGGVYDVPDGLGRQLIDQQEAAEHAGPLTEPDEFAEPETAAATDGGETAALKSRGKRA